MIDIKLVIYIAVAILSVGGAIVTFFQMQTRQNMKIDQLQKDINDLKKKQSLNTGHQIETEKFIAEINVKLEHIAKAIDDLKRNGHP
jgi:septal ring factor EnvC (AmiA/AmiB activator)